MARSSERLRQGVNMYWTIVVRRLGFWGVLVKVVEKGEGGRCVVGWVRWEIWKVGGTHKVEVCWDVEIGREGSGDRAQLMYLHSVEATRGVGMFLLFLLFLLLSE